jgi:hypothetical protein
VARMHTALAPTPMRADQFPTIDDDEALLRRFQDGDKAAERDVVQRMKTDPTWGEAVAECSSTLRTQWLHFLAPEDGFTHEVVAARARTLKRTLLGDQPTKLESLLAERIVICQIALERAEAEYMQQIQQEGTFKRILFYEHLMDRAHRRYVHAMKALAQVQRLHLPVVAQLNVAVNQVNVAAVEDAADARTRVTQSPYDVSRSHPGCQGYDLEEQTS